MYVVVRRDLPLANQAVQACHAVLESTRAMPLPRDAEHPHLVLCQVPNQAHLLKCQDHLSKSGIAHTVFREPDIGNELTAIATERLTGDQRKVLRRYQLLKSPPTCQGGKLRWLLNCFVSFFTGV